jgi:glycosyltransferase involved in cell wall biosynthesis
VARRVTFAVPGDLETLTGGYGYDRRIVAELRRLGWHVDVLMLGEGFPGPSPAQITLAAERLAAVSADGPIVVDGLAFGVLPEVATALQASRSLVALVHHPLALETGLAGAEAERLQCSERTALAAAHRVIATSRMTAATLTTAFDVPAEHIDVVVPGTDRAQFFAVGNGQPPRLLSVAAVVQRKGFDILVEALSRLADLPWHLTIAGDRTRDPVAVAALDAAIARHRLAGRIDCAGAVPAERLQALYAGADLFLLASHYEGYGMAYAEAIAHGLPVIGTTGGAIPEVVPAMAGRLVPPGDVEALAAALRGVLGDSELRFTLRNGARSAAAALPSWADSGARFGRVLDLLL